MDLRIFVFGTTKEGFEIYPKSKYKNNRQLDRERKESYVIYEPREEGGRIIYQKGNLFSKDGRPGHQFGYVIDIENGYLRKEALGSIKDILDDVFYKSFVEKFKIINQEEFLIDKFDYANNLKNQLHYLEDKLQSPLKEYLVSSDEVKNRTIIYNSAIERKKESERKNDLKKQKAKKRLLSDDESITKFNPKVPKSDGEPRIDSRKTGRFDKFLQSPWLPIGAVFITLISSAVLNNRIEKLEKNINTLQKEKFFIKRESDTIKNTIKVDQNEDVKPSNSDSTRNSKK